MSQLGLLLQLPNNYKIVYTKNNEKEYIFDFAIIDQLPKEISAKLKTGMYIVKVLKTIKDRRDKDIPIVKIIKYLEDQPVENIILSGSEIGNLRIYDKILDLLKNMYDNKSNILNDQNVKKVFIYYISIICSLLLFINDCLESNIELDVIDKNIIIKNHIDILKNNFDYILELIEDTEFKDEIIDIYNTIIE